MYETIQNDNNLESIDDIHYSGLESTLFVNNALEPPSSRIHSKQTYGQALVCKKLNNIKILALYGHKLLVNDCVCDDGDEHQHYLL